MNPKVVNLSVIDFGEEECKPSHTVGPAIRSYYLIHYVFSGEGILSIGNMTWQIHAGQCFLIYPGETTTYQANPINPWHYAWIGYTGDVSSNNLTQIAGFSRSQRVLTASFPEKAWQTLLQVSDDIKSSKLGELASLGGLFRFLSLFSSSTGDNVILKLTQYEKAISYIQENYSHAITVRDIANAVNLSRSQLFRVFIKACKKSPKQVLDEMRIDHAKHLLRKTELSVAEVALYAGFNSPAYFNKAFHKTVGISPNIYRKHRKM